jgi:hypothetical protein
VFEQLPSSLFGGLSDFGWNFEHVSRILGLEPDLGTGECNDLLADLDLVLMSRLKDPSSTEPFDLVDGQVGIGAYFLERQSQKAVEAITQVVMLLKSGSERSPNGARWLTPPNLLPEYQRKQAPAGYYNLGVAHGVPGILHFLATAIRLGITHAGIDRLVDDGVDWLLAQQQASLCSLFPYWVADGASPHRSRIAWCYGDLGIAMLLLGTATLLNKQDLANYAIHLLLKCAGRPPDGIVDAALCHGALGVALVFNRAYHMTSDAVFKNAAVRYYLMGLDLIETDLPTGIANRTFLEGTVGIALALLSGVTTVEPRWDRKLMLSSPLSPSARNITNPTPYPC